MKILLYLFTLALTVALVFLAAGVWYGGVTLHSLLTENKRLKESLVNLTVEEQIGYAKVLTQEKREGKLFTRLLFVETARDDKNKWVLQKEYEIEGDVVHFDALIVKFNQQMVIDGKEKSLYLWRRIYGENQAPAEGYPIERAEEEPLRYRELLSKNSLKERTLFWSEIWSLSHDPYRLEKYGITAVYGNVVYSRLKKGFIYVFKISSTGQVHPETVPSLENVPLPL